MHLALRTVVPGFLMFLMVLASPAAAQTPLEKVQKLIHQAGNALDDSQRAAWLLEASEVEGIDPTLRRELAELADVYAKYTDYRNLANFDLRLKKVDLPGAVIIPDEELWIRRDSPAHPLAMYMRIRVWLWKSLQSGRPALGNDHDARKVWDSVASTLRDLHREYPSNDIIGMYYGQLVPWNRELPGAQEAPEWAALQREGLERFADIIHWWIDNRQLPRGTFGGKLGDDVEMWRWWTPLLLGFEDPKIASAQERIATAVLNLPVVAKGYSATFTDVQHTAEDTADAITPMMHLNPDDPQWKQRALRIVELALERFMGVNQQGQLQFKSVYFSVDRVSERPEQAFDTHYHTRVFQPALLLWQRTADPELTRLFTRWMDTWVDAAAREQDGKPAGVFPAGIHWPDGGFTFGENPWYNPMAGDRYARLYTWPHVVGSPMQANAMLLSWHMTGDEKYLQPLRSMAQMRREYLLAMPSEQPEPGTRLWCGSQMGFLAPTLAKYRRLTASREFDDILAHDYPAALALGSENRTELIASLNDLLAVLRYNLPAWTSEVRYTDRVLRFNDLFQPGWMYEQGLSNRKNPDPSILYATVTGDPGDALYFPMNAVRWLTLPRDIAALVTLVDDDHFSAELFHFGDQPRSMGAELYLLKPGRYAVELLDAPSSQVLWNQDLVVEGPRSQVRFELPPQTLCILRVGPQP